ncbi:hypothetical protein C3492_23930 [Streptomyces sp. Ru62]|uniref:hypothetical protein n=1 Tax=Streptomyces sp. Ru62 TaxID=2080745 RepID=UPI000CDD2637|nr:hypothetical protein [Streptomyces sp. Ru62]POX61132.1 hypothetical protein C3492_23930 [Streptomyces sp. Ru62]
MRPCVTRQGVTRLDAHAVHFVSYDGLVHTNPFQGNDGSSPRARLAPPQLPRRGSGPRSGRCTTDDVADRIAHGRAFRLCETASGGRRKTGMPVPSRSSRRTELVPDRDDDACAVPPFGRIAAASRASGCTAGGLLLDAGGLNACGEVVVDETRIRADTVLSFPYQMKSRRRGAPGAGRGRLRPAGVTVM